MPHRSLYVAIDIGAGFGAKVGLFDHQVNQLGETLLSTAEYGKSGEEFADALTETADALLLSLGLDRENVRAYGVATPGLLCSDGRYRLAQNLNYLNGVNLPALLADRVGRPVGIENDANAGALAEWSVMRCSLLYWVFGGGWGGAWVDAAGEVQFPALDWNGDDASLHYTNEPGYAIPLDKVALKMLFHEVGVSFERFERHLCEECGTDEGVVRGPEGSPDHLRAEVILSGPGRCRLFRAAVGDDNFYERFLDIHEAAQMNDPAIAGKYVSKLSSMRVEAAINTDRLFGKVLAEATRMMLKQARHDGCPEDIPICLGGKPAYALPYFGPSAQRAIGKMGFMNYLRPSIIDERGSNANLVGACVVAQKTYEQSA